MRAWFGAFLIVAGGFVLLQAIFGKRFRGMPFARAAYVVMGIVFVFNGTGNLTPALRTLPWMVANLAVVICAVVLLLAAQRRGEYRRRP